MQGRRLISCANSLAPDFIFIYYALSNSAFIEPLHYSKRCWKWDHKIAQRAGTGLQDESLALKGTWGTLTSTYGLCWKDTITNYQPKISEVKRRNDCSKVCLHRFPWAFSLLATRFLFSQYGRRKHVAEVIPDFSGIAGSQNDLLATAIFLNVSCSK